MPKNDVYRQAASVVVLRPSSVCAPDGCSVIYDLLLLHKPRKHDAWQLPQGGIEEGESIEQAAMRELMEEAGINTATVFGKSEECYKYDFPASFRRFRRDEVCGQCIHYVFALAPKDVVVKVDGKEIDSHLWILPEKLLHYLKRPAYSDLVSKLVSEALAQVPATA